MISRRTISRIGLGEPLQRAAIKMAGRERHRLAVGEIDVAQHPPRLRRPRQHAEGGGIGDHQKVAAALHLGHAEAAAGREDRKRRLVRGVLGQERGRHRAAVAHHRRGLVCHDRLSAQDAVLVGKRQADDLEPVFLDPLVGLDRGLELLVAPQSVALDEAVRGSLLR
jgi:hypothetical protein